MVGLKKDLELLRLWTKKHFSFSGSFLYVGGIDIFENKKEDVPFWYRFYIYIYIFFLIFFIYYLFIYLFIYFWLCWVFGSCEGFL